MTKLINPTKISGEFETDHLSAFSVDLVANAKLHRSFLQDLHKLDVSLKFLPHRNNQELALRALYRYCKCWLPLVVQLANKKSDEALSNGFAYDISYLKSLKLVPPADVAWLWHCHRLAPSSYFKYLREEFMGCKNLDLDNSDIVMPFSFQHCEDMNNDKKIHYCNLDSDSEIDAENTRQLWEIYYPDEPFFLQEYVNGMMSIPKESSKLMGFDLLGSIERQALFLWQISSSAFDDESFLKDGVSNYLKFLLLKRMKNAEVPILVPTYQIDLLWHTHMLSSAKLYDIDCRNITGSSFNHDDSLNDRSEGSDLNVAFDKTSKYWLTTYGSQYKVEGGMYRGEPPHNYFTSDWSSRADKDVGNVIGNIRLIGVVGAGSSNVNESADVLEWISPLATLPNNEPAFVEMNEKSTVKGVNANPKKENFIFGEGSRGIGYYHEQTRDAYQIVCKRLEKRIDDIDEGLGYSYIFIFCCFPCFFCLIFCWSFGDSCQPFCDSVQRMMEDLFENLGLGIINSYIFMIFFLLFGFFLTIGIKEKKKELSKLKVILREVERRKAADRPYPFSKEVSDRKSGNKHISGETNYNDQLAGGLIGGSHSDYGAVYRQDIHHLPNHISEAAGCGGGSACSGYAAACGAGKHHFLFHNIEA